MKRTKILGLALVAVFAISAMAASAASAATFEGPSWIVKKVRLAEGKNEAFTSKGATFKLASAKLGLTIVCKKVTNKGTIKGSAAKKVGTDEAEITFTECSVEQDEKCVVTSLTNEEKTESVAKTIGPIKVLTEEVSLNKPPKVEKAGDLFTSTELTAAKKAVFVVLKLKGCTKESLDGKYNVTGKVVAELGKIVSGAFKATVANEEEVIGALNFPATAIETVYKWVPASETYEATTVKIELAETPSILTGVAEIELTSKMAFGWTNT